MIKLQPLVESPEDAAFLRGRDDEDFPGQCNDAKAALVKAIDKLEALVDVYRRYLHPVDGKPLHTLPLARIQGPRDEPTYCCQPHWYTLDEALKVHVEDLRAAEAYGELLWLDDDAEARWNEIKERL